jgi:hypothetical protein
MAGDLAGKQSSATWALHFAMGLVKEKWQARGTCHFSAPNRFRHPWYTLLSELNSGRRKQSNEGEGRDSGSPTEASGIIHGIVYNINVFSLVRSADHEQGTLGQLALLWPNCVPVFWPRSAPAPPSDGGGPVIAHWPRQLCSTILDLLGRVDSHHSCYSPSNTESECAYSVI